ncbi:hypothetical protein VPH35_132859 [Triticum aestivum]
MWTYCRNFGFDVYRKLRSSGPYTFSLSIYTPVNNLSHQPFGQCFVVPMFMGGTTDQRVVEENLEKLKVALGVYKERLTRSQYLARDFISLADLSHCAMAHYLLASPCASVLDAYPRVKAWVHGMMDRPSVKKVMELMDAS